MHTGAIGNQAASDEMAFASRMLAAHAVTLDTMFTELARRAALNVGEYLNAAARSARLALKAQSNSRATLEALAKLHQPREHTGRHVLLSEGGQAIVAENVHHHALGAHEYWISQTTPCNRNGWPMHRAASPGRGPGRRANRQR